MENQIMSMSYSDPYFDPTHQQKGDPLKFARDQGFINEVASEDSVKQLNSLLRGEISAVETYAQVVDKIDSRDICEMLEDCQGEHVLRAQKLRRRIAELGGEPADSSGVWGGFAKTVEAAATVMGDQAAISVLEEGEVRGLKQYENIAGKVDAQSAEIINEELLPAQRRTHEVVSRIKQAGL